jgi:hypothetical protein
MCVGATALNDVKAVKDCCHFNWVLAVWPGAPGAQ